MRVPLVFLACAAALGLAAGCNDTDCSTCAPVLSDQPLAQMDIGMGGREDVILSDTLRISFVSSNAETLFSVRISPADQGATKLVSASNYPRFAAAATRLSDGVNDQWTFWLHMSPGNIESGSTSTESGWLHGGYLGIYTPDLYGAEITRIWINLKQVTVDQDVDHTSYYISGQVVIMGKP